jgi:hypothetical protein
LIASLVDRVAARGALVEAGEVEPYVARGIEDGAAREAYFVRVLQLTAAVRKPDPTGRSLTKEIFGDGHGGYRPGPAGVEGDVGDGLFQLGLGVAVIPG